ncbi:MAG TPA: HD domain-containing protein [Humidesulfovibrio sp.]|uniref:3'-5' exoribonuclease YhaM family protein n=1 Tax=Humidesulfovibrio sp. TaxID=2910988 RepID=UPI002C9AD73C|nr:HD domain-containing protein [Humidesulfovibrio sp.]HWR04073.1 HD domain-containing protein [Humidesulfovibrio sp.]
MIAKAVYIRDISPGQTIQDYFLLAEARTGTSRNGPYWSLMLQDATGQMEAKIWSPLSLAHPGLSAGQLVQVRAQAANYRDKCQLTIDQLTEVDVAEADLAEFLPPSPVDPEALLAQVEELCRRELTHKPWRGLMKKILADPEVRGRLLPATGAKAVHHAYAGGLLEHTLAVARTCLALADLYPHLDRQILLVAALLHDLGKAWELTSGLSHEYTDEGRLLGHIQLGLTRIEPFLAKAKDLDEGLALHLRHLIISHHGEYEFGAPKRPKTPEAFILHFADNIDAKMNTMAGAYAELEGTDQGWTPFQRYLDRYLYRAPHTPEAPATGFGLLGGKDAKDAADKKPAAKPQDIDERFLLLPLGSD